MSRILNRFVVADPEFSERVVLSMLMQVATSGYKSIQVDANRRKSIQVDASRYKSLHVDAGRCKSMKVSASFKLTFNLSFACRV